jgi:urease accessory protein
VAFRPAASRRLLKTQGHIVSAGGIFAEIVLRNRRAGRMNDETLFTMKKLAFPVAALLLIPTLAQAHPGHGATGFVQGFSHPLSGLDHLLAMLAVGLWAAQMGGRARWAVPATFVSLMALGGALGMAGLHLPMVEPGIAASVLVLGLLIAASARLSLAAAMPLVGVFALFHGFAHGAEMPASVSGFEFAAGFVLVTATLHAAGIGLGMAMQRVASAPLVRFAGAAIAVAGVAIAAGW